MDADGGNVQQLTASPGHDWGPVWSPDGQRIAFASDRTGNFEVYVMDADGGNVQQLTENPGEDFEPVWSPDGERLAFGSRRPPDLSEIAIYLMAPDGSGIEPTGVRGIPSDWFSTPRGS
jgi:TolB protein